MNGFLSRLFGGGKKSSPGAADVERLVKETLNGVIERGGFDLKFNLTHTEENGEPVVIVNFEGADEDLLKDREGQLIDAFQLFLKRVIQHHIADDKTNIVVDCNGYREESSQALVELAEKLKGIALEKGKSVYFRALPPKDRKVVHQYLAGDSRIRSRSIGEGLFKKIKIYPVKNNKDEETQAAE